MSNDYLVLFFYSSAKPSTCLDNLSVYLWLQLSFVGFFIIFLLVICLIGLHENDFISLFCCRRKFVQSFHSPSPVRDRYILNRRSSSRDLPSHSHSLEKDQLESYSITIRNDRQLTPSPSPTAYRYGDGREEIRATEQVLRAGYRYVLSIAARYMFLC